MVNAKQKLKTLSVIGAGYWGQNIVRNFYEIGVLHTICDVNEELLLRYKSQYPDINITTNIQDIFNNPLITQVAIATPTPTHYAIAKQVILSGKDVYVEKPLCLDFLEGEELVRLAEEKGSILMVGHILQYHPSILKLQEMVKSGELGIIHYIAASRLNLGKIKIKENAIWDLATHDVSIMLSLLNDRMPLHVRCTGGDYFTDGGGDIALMVMEFPDNVQAHIHVSWLNPIKEQKLTVIGSMGIAVFDDTRPWNEKLTFYRNHIVFDEDNIPQENPQKGEYIGEIVGNPLKSECIHFLQCSKNRTTPKTGGRESLRVLGVLQAAQESFNENGQIKDPFLIQQSLLVGT